MVRRRPELVIIVDALARGGAGRRVVTVDAVGAGPRTVAGVLEQVGVDVDLTVSEKVFEQPGMLRSYDVLMVSAMSIDEPTVKRIIRAWRRFRGDAPAIVGGPAALDPGFIERVAADLAVHGEAEPVVEKLFREEMVSVSGIDYDRLGESCGVAYRVPGNGVRVNPRCPLMPRRVWERYRPGTRVITGYPGYWAARVYVETVRGCSNYTFPDLSKILPSNLLPDKPKPGCAYCSVISLWGYARSRSIDLVYWEVKSLIEQGVRRIVLSGPDFLDYGRDWLVEPRPLVDPLEPPANVDALRSLLSRLTSISEVASGEVSIMVENVKPSLVTEDSASALGDYLRGTPVHIGVETGDERLLKLLGRPATLRKTVEAVRLLSKHGLRPYVYIMYCLPGETMQTIKKTLDLIEKLYRLGTEKITAYRFTPLPGSSLEKLAGGWEPHCPALHPMKMKAMEINKRAKKRMIGRTDVFIVAGVHPRLERPVGYPLRHGPVAVLEGESVPATGALVKARVTGVLNDRMVEATVIDIVNPGPAKRGTARAARKGARMRRWRRHGYGRLRSPRAGRGDTSRGRGPRGQRG